MNSSDEAARLPEDEVEAVAQAALAAARVGADVVAVRAALLPELLLLAARVRAEAVADERVAIVAELEAAGHLAAMNLIAVCGGPTFGERIAEAVAEERHRLVEAIETVRLEYEALNVDRMWSGGMQRAVTIIRAAGSVPVATPPESRRLGTELLNLPASEQVRILRGLGVWEDGEGAHVERVIAALHRIPEEDRRELVAQALDGPVATPYTYCANGLHSIPVGSECSSCGPIATPTEPDGLSEALAERRADTEFVERVRVTDCRSLGCDLDHGLPAEQPEER